MMCSRHLFTGISLIGSSSTPLRAKKARKPPSLTIEVDRDYGQFCGEVTYMDNKDLA